VTHKISKYMILAIGALGLSALPALADNACAMYNGDTLSYFETTVGSCYIGNLDFSNFSYTSSTSTGGSPYPPVPATAVYVDTVVNSAGIGLSFNSSWDALGSFEFSDADIGFSVSVIGGGAATIEDASLIQTGNIDSNNDGSIASVGEDACSGSLVGTPCTQQWKVDTSETSNSTATANDVIFTPTGTITVSKDLNAQDGVSSSDFSQISKVVDQFSQVPEPRSLSLLLGLSLIAGLALKKKLQSVQS